jgi:hypothetical protein
MRGRVMMFLASAALASSLVATGAEARGGGFGGGHIGSFGGGHYIGAFGGSHIPGRFGADNMVTGRSVAVARPILREPLFVGGSCASLASPQACNY